MEAAIGFLGEFRHTVDEKGRLTLPARIRDQLGAAFVATKGLDGCLFFFTSPEWDAMEAALTALPLTQKDARDYTRAFFSSAAECHCDSQGRVLLPSALRAHARLEREGVVVGAGKRVEVWNPQAWDNYISQVNAEIGNIAERLGALR